MSQIPEWYDEVLTAAISVNQLLHRSFDNKEFKHNILKNLCGACHIGSVLLKNRIKHLKPTLVIGKCEFYPGYKNSPTTGHCWLELGDYIIDCTYSQFVRYENIKICHKNSLAAKRYKSDMTNRQAYTFQRNVNGNQSPAKWRYCKIKNHLVPTALYFKHRQKSLFTNADRKLFQ